MRPVTRRALAAAAALALGALAAPASAQQAAPAASGTVERAPGETGSERTMGVEVKLGGFKPRIDSEPGLGGTPYQDTFGDSAMLLLEGSGERQFFQAFGTAGVGLSAGYAEKFAPAHLADGTPASESTGLRLVPLSLFGVYRFDYAAHVWGIPLVPYVKAGLHYTLWWSTKGASLETTSSGGSAIGGRWGWGFSGGLSLLLDVFEPRVARDFDTDAGVNHSYLFVELNYADVNNFYTGGLDLSGRYLTFGIAFEL
jgi:hypothetical protein